MKGVGHMQMVNKRLTAILMAACLLVALTFGGYSVAQAADWWPNPGNNELTVCPTGNEELQKDLADVEAYVNLFKVADAVPEENYEAFTYEYVYNEYAHFGHGPVPTPEAGDPSAKEKWQDIAREAALVVQQGDGGPTVGGGDFKGPGYNVTMSELEDGIYLAVILSHKDGYSDWERDESGSATGSTVITGARAEYTFQPQLIALPSKKADGSESASSDSGDWLKKLTITLKPEVKGRYGSLVINKTVNGASAEPATFVFHYTVAPPAGDGYDGYASIYYPAQTSTVVTHIPAGSTVTVVEEYPGPRFDGDGTTQTATIVADEPQAASVSFTNTANGSQIGGHGIENHFELTPITGEGEGAWDWTWTATPAQGA